MQKIGGPVVCLRAPKSKNPDKCIIHLCRVGLRNHSLHFLSLALPRKRRRATTPKHSPLPTQDCTTTTYSLTPLSRSRYVRRKESPSSLNSLFPKKYLETEAENTENVGFFM